MTTELSKIQDGRTLKCNSNYVDTMRTHEIRKYCPIIEKIVLFDKTFISTCPTDFDCMVESNGSNPF